MIRKWLGQSTTGTGLSALAAYLAAIASGSMTWVQAMPLLIGGLVGLVWPEDAGLKAAAQATAISIERLVEAYRIGLQHGAVSVSSATATSHAQGDPSSNPERGSGS